MQKSGYFGNQNVKRIQRSGHKHKNFVKVGFALVGIIKPLSVYRNENFPVIPFCNNF